MIRVRFAPSPTGYLHIGGARTALFNWLFARHQQGEFLLRIEDTDRLRSTKESIDAIINGLSWLGLDWDKEIFFQSQRLKIYQEYASQLLREGKAYYCYCTPEELELRRQQARREKRPPKYDGRCRQLSPQQKEVYEKEGRKKVVRFKMPSEGTTEFNDLIRSKVVFQNSLLDDFVILKADGMPTYNFAVVIDDALLEISHVIRGEDHISNTPRQILLYKALNLPMPQFAHLPMILGPDGTRLSKRHGATAVEEYQRQGYLPQAMVNYLALLGWATEESQQIFTKNELIEKFSLKRCTKSAAIFDPQKLLWMNGIYIRKIGITELTNQAMPWLKEKRLVSDRLSPQEEAYLQRAIALEQERAKLLSDFPGLIEIFLQEEVKYEEEALDALKKRDTSLFSLQQMTELLKKVEPFTAPKLEEAIRGFAKAKGLKTGAVFHPLRIFVSGRTRGPGLFELLALLGKEKVLQRLRNFLTTRFAQEFYNKN